MMDRLNMAVPLVVSAYDREYKLSNLGKSHSQAKLRTT